MSIVQKFVVAAVVPGGVLAAMALGAMWLLRCRHAGEMWDRVDGVQVLRCRRCGKVRQNLLAGPRLVPKVATGIERMRGEWREDRITDEMLWRDR